MSEYDWWSQDGEDVSLIAARMDEAQKANIEYGRRGFPLIFAFPGTNPRPEAIKWFNHFSALHPNNIMTHTSGHSEKGFGGTQGLEKEVIYMLGNLSGSSNPEKEIDGYIAPGGCEGNY